MMSAIKNYIESLFSGEKVEKVENVGFQAMEDIYPGEVIIKEVSEITDDDTEELQVVEKKMDVLILPEDIEEPEIIPMVPVLDSSPVPLLDSSPVPVPVPVLKEVVDESEPVSTKLNRCSINCNIM